MYGVPRLLYRGPSDATAITKRFLTEDDVEAALADGWRLHRRNPGETENDEPHTAGQNDPELQIPRTPEGKRLDGPTLEEYVAAGYLAENYPPLDYAEKPSDGLSALREQQAAAAADTTKKAAEEAAQPAADAVQPPDATAEPEPEPEPSDSKSDTRRSRRR